MDIFRPRERLHLVAPALDWLLEVGKIVLLPVAVLSLGYRFLFQIAQTTRETHGAVILSSLAVAVCVIYIVLIQTKPAKELISGITNTLRRSVVISCASSAKTVASAWTLCRLASAEFRRRRVAYPDQKAAVDRLIESINEHKSGSDNFSIVLGESGHGKTRMAFLLADALIRDRKLCGLSDRVLYYDFVQGPRAQEIFSRRLGGVKHWDSVVVVDNFHHASPQILRSVTRHLLDSAGTTAERFLLILAQPPKAWKSASGGEARILGEAKQRGRLLKLGGVSKDAISRESLAPALRTHAERIGKLNIDRIASIVELHILQMAGPKQADTGVVNDVLRLFGADDIADRRRSIRIRQVIGIAAALAIHRGNFSAKSFANAAWRASQGEKFASAKVLRLRMTLHRLAVLGVIPRTSLPGQLFVFHEALAAAFRKALASDRIFEEAFEAAMAWRLARGEDRRDPIVQWIGACELADAARMSASFEHALLSGGLHVMAAHLEPNLARLPDSASATFQLGMLLDRCGRFADARIHFETLRGMVAVGDPLADRLELAATEAAHGEDCEAKLSIIAQRKNPENALAAKYWLLHLRGHRGDFDALALANLGDELVSRFGRENISENYSLLYLGARVFFDGCRHGFLADRDPLALLQRMDQSVLASTLRDAYPQFGAMRVLYLCAHVSGHILLATYKIFGRLDPGAMKFLGLDKSQVSHQFLIEFTRKAYIEARDEFSISGDRESLYLEGDLINIDICDPTKDLDELQGRLNDYEEFIRKSGFADISSYPRFYWYRWHIAKRFRILEAEHPDLTEVDWHDAQALRSLDQAEGHDRVSGNVYGQWRCRLHRELFEALRSPDAGRAISALTALQLTASEAGYERDADFLEALIGSEGLALREVRQSLLFHPFVHQ